MSADSPRRAVRGVPAIVPPQVVSDPSIIDSVAGFINDVTLTNQPLIDPKDTITWARFETQADISDLQFGNEDWELEGCAPPPLILILGYGIGIQVWAIPANGEAVEVLSWRHGNVTALRVLPTPTSTDVNFDRYSDKRPLMALCEGPTPGSSSQYCTVNFVSLRDSSTVKSIKFKNPVLDILTNKTFVVITFPERIAVFDARSLDDHLSITSCYPSPGINPNPVALGHRWLAYSESRLIHTKRTQGGCEVEGVPSYTATMLNAAKSLGKGLKEFGETVAAGLKGSSSGTGSSSKPGSFESGSGDTKQPGVITIFDIKHPIKDISPTSGTPISVTGDDPIVAHFVAHSDAIVAMEFDPSGMLLLTADKRGHDFHIFKIFNHALSSNLSAVHHLYILHRGDTTAKVQNISFSPDSRWVAVSTLRGTTHVFPITPYGGAAGVRTHTNPYVVNRLSRFHRSAGLSADGRSSSPISSHSDITQYNPICMPYNNVTVPPFPKPVVILPFAKLRQPSVLGSPPGSAQNSYNRSTHGQRQRLSSLSDENGKPLSVTAVFAKARSWLLDGPKLSREQLKVQQKVVDSLFIMAGHGALIQYDLDVKIAQNVPKDKVSDESPIELDVEAKAQWNLGRKDNFVEIQPPLCPDNWLMKDMTDRSSPSSGASVSPQIDDWVSQVEIMTHAGPGRRLWMGPQCVFKTYNTPSGSSLNHIDSEAVEVPINVGSSRPGRSSPMNMPLSNSGRSSVPFVIESGSYSSIDQSPRLMEKFCHDNFNSEFDLSQGDSRLREDLADAMRESPSGQHKDAGLTPRLRHMNTYTSMPSTSAKSSGSDSNRKAQGDSGTRGYSSSAQQFDINALTMSPQTQPARSVVLIEKVVNPQGTVTTITRSPNENEYDPNDPYAWLDTDYVIHENFDEALFRPVVTIFCDDKRSQEASRKVADFEFVAPEPIKTDLIVPVIEGKHPDFEGGMPPESMKAELVVPVVEEVKNSQKESGDFKRAPKTFEDSMKNVSSSDEVPAGITKIKGSKKNTLKSSFKEKTPPKDLSLDLPDPPPSLSYENENYNSEIKKPISNAIRNKKEKEVSFEVKEKRAKDRATVTFELRQQERENVAKVEKEVTTKTEGSEERDLKLLEKNTLKTNTKSRKISREETVDVHVSRQNTVEETVKIKPEKQFKGKIVPDLDQKKMLRVSSDTKITKTKGATKQNNEMVSSCTDEICMPLDDLEPESKVNTSVEKEEKAFDPSDSDGGLQFFDKFSADSPKKVSKAKTETLTESEIDFPSLAESMGENKKVKKPKGNSSSSTAPSQASSKLPQKSSEKIGDSKFSDDEATEVVTITLPSKKRQTKSKSCTGDNSTKKSEVECEKSAGDYIPPPIDKTDSAEHTSKEKTNKGNGKKSGKAKDFPKLALESTTISTDFTEAFLPPLSPLEPFESNFESLHFKEPTGDTDSLINFDSPPQENKSKNKTAKTSPSTSKLMNDSSDLTELKSLHSGYENLIFALCGSIHHDSPLEGNTLEEEPNCSSSPASASTTISSVVKVNKYSKESRRKSIENDEQYLSLDRNYNENTSSSSEDIDESSCMRKKTHGKLIDDDEELRPLISGANSACSMASSTSGKKEYDTPSIALEIAKAIVDTLPDNSSNQSDSSDQANISDPEIQNTVSAMGALGTSSSAAPLTGTRTDPIDSTKTSAQLDLTENGSSVAPHQNGKKKLKKKKR